MKQSKLVGVIKMNNKTKETVWAHGHYSYTKTKRENRTNQEEREVMKEVLVKYMEKEEKQKERTYEYESIESILNRIDERTRSYEFSRYIDRCQQEDMKRFRKKYAPRTKMQALMDKVGIDRYRIYDMLCEIEKCFE